MVFLFFYLYGVSGIVQRIVPAPGDKISSDSISMALSCLKPAYVANLVSPANLRQGGSFAKLFFVFFAAFTEKKNTRNSRIFAKDSAGEPERSCWRYPISRAAHPALLLHVSVLI